MCHLCEASVCAEYLSVDPSAVRTGEEGDDAGNIVGLTEPLEGSHATDLLNLFFRLAVEKKLGGNGSGGNGVDGDFMSAKLICEDVDEAFNTCFGGDVWAVGGEVLGEDAAGEGDDTAALCNVLRRLREDEKGSSEVGGDDFVEGFNVALGDGRERHDTCVVDDDIDLPEGLEGLLEELLDVFRVGNVGLDGEGAAASAGDLIDDLFCFGCIAGVVDHDAEAVGCEAKSDGTSDAAGCAGYDSYLSHGNSPLGRLLRI